MSDWSLYLIRCRDGELYTGITNDVDQRIAQHRDGKGAKYTRGKGPLVLAFQQRVGDRSLASRLEWRVKRLRKQDKERLVVGEFELTTLLNEG